MRHYLLACSLSALVGGLLAMWFQEGGSRPEAAAQERDVSPPVPTPSRALIDDTHLDPQLRSQRGATVTDSVARFTPEEQVNISVYERVNRGVVNITTRAVSREMLLMLEAPSEGAGSGSVLDTEGHILTNDHVIRGAADVRVTLFNGETYPAVLVGRDAANDVAVLDIDAPAKFLYPVTLGDSSDLRVGQRVFAIGNPFGLERTMTGGILSSVNRTLASPTGRDMKSILQIDAALNRGNSGGPLLNTRAELIGMNSAIASPSGAGENTGVGFAIPVNTLKRMIPQLIEHGRVIRPVIGITHVYESDQGLVVINVVPGGPADRAGLQGFRVVRERRGAFVFESIDRSSADLIVAVDGKQVRTRDDLLDIVESRQPGDRVMVTVIRELRPVDVPVVLGSNE
jgi:S1-C subfamily serine protease